MQRTHRLPDLPIPRFPPPPVTFRHAWASCIFAACAVLTRPSHGFQPLAQTAAKVKTPAKPAAKAKATPAKSTAAKKSVTKKAPAKKATPAKKADSKSPKAKPTKGKAAVRNAGGDSK